MNILKCWLRDYPFRLSIAWVIVTVPLWTIALLDWGAPVWVVLFFTLAWSAASGNLIEWASEELRIGNARP